MGAPVSSVFQWLTRGAPSLGSISQWGEVSKPKKERAKPKGKDNIFTTTTGDSPVPGGARPARGGRTGPEGHRARGRATERGGRGSRGRSVATANGARFEKNQQLSVPTEESFGLDPQKTDGASPPAESGAWDKGSPPATAAPAPAAANNVPSKAAPVPSGNQKTWASMLRQSTAPKPAPKPKEVSAPKGPDVIEPLPPAAPPAIDEPEPAFDEVADSLKKAAGPDAVPVVVPEIALIPSRDRLTETNLEQVVDTSSGVPPTESARSEATDSWDPRAPPISAGATPNSASQHQHQVKALTSGYAVTAMKAADRVANRTPSYTRRLLDQEEAVRMPGNREDRAAVQFGALNLNFSGIDDDIDGDREEPETRAQPPDDSPIAHPRTSLPPVSQPASLPDAYPLQKPASAHPLSGATGTAAF